MVSIFSRIVLILTYAVWASSASAVPITGENVATVDGFDWAQPDLFTNLSWNDINAVCPAGVCVEGGVLNGYTMTGWSWASVDDVNALFNAYLRAAGVTEPDLLGPGPDSAAPFQNYTWAPAFMADFRATVTAEGLGEETTGYTRNTYANVLAYKGSVRNYYDPQIIFGDDSASTSGHNNSITSSYDSIGGWFYAGNHPPSVPVPTTLLLLSIALAGIGWTRRTKT